MANIIEGGGARELGLSAESHVRAAFSFDVDVPRCGTAITYLSSLLFPKSCIPKEKARPSY